MKKIFILVFALAVFSCTNDKKKSSQTLTSTSSEHAAESDKGTTANTNSSATASNSLSADPKLNLIGQWKEHWGIGVETNVNYNDLYNVAVDDAGKISINCTNKKKYKIDQVLFDGQEISFRKQNKAYPLGRFYVYYKLKLHDDLRWMEGPITNTKKQKDYVKWEKVAGKN